MMKHLIQIMFLKLLHYIKSYNKNVEVKNLKKIIAKVFQNILYDTITYTLLFVLIGLILNKQGYVYLKWFIYTNMLIIIIGIIIGTIQMILKKIEKGNKLIITTVTVILELIFLLSIYIGFMLFQNQERFVYRDNKKMVKEAHSFLSSNWINYYDFQNIFIRKKQVRIYEAHNNYIGDLVSTIYYDAQGNVIYEEK